MTQRRHGDNPVIGEGYTVPAFNSPDWHRRANCLGLNDDTMFGDTARARVRENVAYIKSICADCPVQLACLEVGMNEDYGVWGGLTPAERQSLRRKTGKRKSMTRQMFCPRGHSFNDANTGIRRNGNRYCKACDRLNDQKQGKRKFA